MPCCDSGESGGAADFTDKALAAGLQLPPVAGD